jgi:hypothetical protein
MNTLLHKVAAKNFPLRLATVVVPLLVVAFFSACSPKPETLIPKIQQESQIFVDALNNCNEEQAAKKLHKSLVDNIPMPLKEWLKLRVQGFNGRGYRFDSAQIGVPQLPQFAAGHLVSFVPVRTTVVLDDRLHPSQMPLFGPTSITMATFLVAVSNDQGRSWTFFEAGENRSLADALLPDIAPNLVFPGRLVDIETN